MSTFSIQITLRPQYRPDKSFIGYGARVGNLIVAVVPLAVRPFRWEVLVFVTKQFNKGALRVPAKSMQQARALLPGVLAAFIWKRRPSRLARQTESTC